jgi:hypothetical protein
MLLSQRIADRLVQTHPEFLEGDNAIVVRDEQNRQILSGANGPSIDSSAKELNFSETVSAENFMCRNWRPDASGDPHAT